FESFKKNRKEQSELFKAYESALSKSSEREAAKDLGVPRTTLQHWRKRKSKIGLSKQVVSFFESPEGNEFLHELVTALLFGMVQLGGCGIRLVSLMLELCHLDHFVGNSIGSLHKLNVKMEEDIVNYGDSEGKRLSKGMPSKKISTCDDETFHPTPCLVSIEPVSNFILTEKYSEKRDAASWSLAMKEGLKDLPVTVIQSTSDEGTGLIKYVEKELGIHHSPDLFHVQQELTRATSGPLNAKVRKATAEYQEASERTQKLIKKKENGSVSNKKKRHDLDKKLFEAKINEERTKLNLEEATKHLTDTQEAKRALGEIYHPFNLKTGEAQTPEQVSLKLEEQFSLIKGVAVEAKLSENSFNRLEKAHRVFKGMVATLAFFWTTVKTYIADLGLTKELEILVIEVLIPAIYLEITAKKARNAEEKKLILAQSNGLFERLNARELWLQLDEKERLKIEKTAKNCAELFQRSSSCVEGRNGYLSLRHHGLHKLSTRKLTVLTVLHNYFIKRPNGTTAAERFFEQKPKELFEVLLQQLPYPPRSAMKNLKLAA
nr:DUF6399 domain-containing protein [Alphaproteobacteria bacterium]HQS94827.1 DUF6399 domain-containing protein [Alphaproteobacteria bacterium]